MANLIFFGGGTSGFRFSYLSFIDIDTTENYVHSLYIIVNRNQEFIFV